jgi:hypothetical protein
MAWWAGAGTLKKHTMKGGEKSMADPKQAIRDQKDIEDFLSSLGFEPVEEFEEQRVLFTKYEKLGIGVRIERNL